MLVTDREDIYRRVLILRDHGRQPGDTMFRNAEVAFKYKMSSMQAALGLAQLERVEELLAKKRQIFSWYAEDLAGVEDLRLNFEPKDVRNSYWMVTAVCGEARGSKENVIAEMRNREIDCRPFFYPLSSLDAYRGSIQAEQASKRNKVSYGMSPRGLNLPSGLTLTRQNVAYVATVFKTLLSS